MTNTLPGIFLYHSQINQQYSKTVSSVKINKQDPKNKSPLHPEDGVKQQAGPQGQQKDKPESKAPHTSPPNHPDKS